MANRMMIYVLVFCLFAILLSCGGFENNKADYNIIPLPRSISKQSEGGFILDGKSTICVPSGNTTLVKYANEFINYIKTYSNINVSFSDKLQNSIVLELDNVGNNDEGYNIEVGNNAISIKAKTHKGIFYALNLLKKSIISIIAENNEATSILYPSVKIADEPRFSYRGMMLDVSRHFSTVDEVKRVLDILAWHNINIFHWHLADDQGWRLEIKSHPQLSKISAWRKSTMLGRPNGTDIYPADGKKHGGYYSQKEIKDIISYAADRNIEIIPEIDLPGHNQAVLAAYPSLGCTGGPYKVCDRWGVIKDVLCVGNPNSLKFYKDVFSEIMELFPSNYIHIGGDECVKDRWEVCPKCQGLIKRLDLKPDSKCTKEDLLQSYFMSKIAEFIQNKGKQVIGWDEILEGKPVENAIIMSWRGIQGGVEAAKKQHKVIMSPTTHLYFDYSQTLNTSNEEIPVGGYINVEKVYNYEPHPEELTDEECKYIIGLQSNVWTEYIPSEHIRDYQMLPRLAALSEVQWREKGTKDYSLFLDRLPNMIKLYDLSKYNYAKHIFNVSISDAPVSNKGLEVKMSTLGNENIYYTLDGTNPTKESNLYKSPIVVSESAKLRALALHHDQLSEISELNIDINKATFKNIKLDSKLNRLNVYAGAKMLVDGVKGSLRSDDARWLGLTHGLNVTIDLGDKTLVSRVALSNLSIMKDCIADPCNMSVSVSNDGENFKTVAAKDIIPKIIKEESISEQVLSFNAVEARYVKIIAETEIEPEGYPLAGEPFWMFVSEIDVH